jgi:hypothetical protein
MMATMDQIREGVMRYAEKEIVPGLEGIKQVLVGAGLEFYLRKKLPQLVGALGIAEDDGQVDVNLLEEVLVKRVNAMPNGMELKLNLNPMNKADVDVFRIRGSDVQKLAAFIRGGE